MSKLRDRIDALASGQDVEVKLSRDEAQFLRTALRYGRDGPGDFWDELRQREADTIEARVAHDLDAMINQRAQKSAAILAVLGAVGIAILGWLGKEYVAARFSLMEQINRTTITTTLGSELPKSIAAAEISVRDSLRAELDTRLESLLGAEPSYMYLAYAAFTLSQTASFSTTDRDGIISALDSVAKHPQFARRPEFPVMLEKIIDSFIAAGQENAVDKVVTMFRDTCFASQGISISLLEHYSKRLIRSATDSTPSREFARSAFEDAADSLGRQWSGSAIAYRQIISYATGSGSPEIRSDRMKLLAKSSDPSTTNDPRFRFLFTMFGMTEQRLLGIREGLEEVVPIAERTALFYTDHISDIGMIAEALATDHGTNSLETIVQMLTSQKSLSIREADIIHARIATRINEARAAAKKRQQDAIPLAPTQ